MIVCCWRTTGSVAAFEDFTLVRGLYCEVKASALAACGTPNLHGMQGGIVGGFICVLRRAKLSRWVSRHWMYLYTWT